VSANVNPTHLVIVLVVCVLALALALAALDERKMR